MRVGKCKGLMNLSSSSQALTSEMLSSFCEDLKKINSIPISFYDKYNVKRGLRNSDGTGVMAGLTKVCSVEGYYIDDGEKIPKEGKLFYRGIDVDDIVQACQREKRFGFEEVAYLLLFGILPTAKRLADFSELLSSCRDLPNDFIDDVIMSKPSANLMNNLARGVLALYAFDDDPDNIAIENVLRQSIFLISRLPLMMSYAYQVKRRNFYRKSMYIHPLKPGQKTAEVILNSIRADKQFTDEEAHLLDLCLMLHADHGGGNNSTFATRLLTSSGTDTYSAISAAIGSLKGPLHGGANAKVIQMVSAIKDGVSNPLDEGQIADFLTRVVRKEAFDGRGLIYGVGHAVYTLSDPRAVILKQEAKKFSSGTEFEEDFQILSAVERLTPEVLAKEKNNVKKVCANVDLYSGLIYKMLRIPEDLFTPLFAVSRTAGWCAHRIEENMTGKRIIRPAYKSLSLPLDYIPLYERTEDTEAMGMRAYIPTEER